MSGPVPADPPEVLFRDAIEADLVSILTLYADDELGATRDRVTVPVAPEYLAAFADIQARPATRLIVGETGGRVVFTMQLDILAGLTFGGSRRLQIESVRTASDLRSSGIGRIAMDWAIRYGREQGCGMVQLTTNKIRRRAHSFYEGLGFVASHEGMKLSLGGQGPAGSSA